MNVIFANIGISCRILLRTKQFIPSFEAHRICPVTIEFKKRKKRKKNKKRTKTDLSRSSRVVLRSIYTIVSRSSMALFVALFFFSDFNRLHERSIERATKRVRRSRASKRADRRVGRYSIAPQGSSTAGATRSFARSLARTFSLFVLAGAETHSPLPSLYLSRS